MSTQANVSINQQNTPTTNSNRWLTHFLESRVFLRLPAKNLQQLIPQFEEIKVNAGDCVIEAGTPAHHYYIVKQGTLDIHTNGQSTHSITDGEGFGEEVLAGQYSYNVIATSPCQLMRLTKETFSQLLVSPVLQTTYASSVSGNIHLVDTNDLSIHDRLGALHIPFQQLRLQLTSLNKKTDYLISHREPGMREASAFLLSQLGYSVSILDGELALPDTTPAPHVDDEQGIDANLLAELDALDAQIESLTTLGITAINEQLDQPSAPRNTGIECIELGQEMLWTPIDVAKEMKPHDLKILNTPVTKSTTVETENWLSDNYVWEKVLGFDGTREVDELLEQEHKKTIESLKLKEAESRKSAPHHHKVRQAEPKTTPAALKPDVIEQLQKHQSKQTKTSYKTRYITAIALAVSLAAWPFLMPNTWNEYYNKTINTLSNSQFTLLSSTTGETALSLENTSLPATKTNNDEQLRLDRERELALEQAKSQARAELAQKLNQSQLITPTP